MSQLHRRLVVRVRDLAEQKSLVLSHLPERAGVARSHFWDVLRLEKSPTLAWLERIAAALEVDVAALLSPLADEAAFLRVDGTEDERYKTALPLLTLADAVRGAHAVEWVQPKTRRRLKKTMFVARAPGRAMEPALPQHAYGIFDTAVPDLLGGRVLLLQHADINDPESGATYTVRRWKSARGQVTLHADQEPFPPLVFPAREAKNIAVIAELVEVLPTT